MTDDDSGQRVPIRETTTPELVVAIGGSAGSFHEIVKIVEGMPKWFSGTVLIATHRTPDHRNTLAEILNLKAQVKVEEPENQDCLECTTVYVGNARHRVEIAKSEFDVKEDVSIRSRMRRIDDLFLSVANNNATKTVGVILSGMLTDGAIGLKAIADSGGICMIQRPDQADWSSMPKNALAAVPNARVGTTEDIIGWLKELAAEPS